MKKTYFPLGLCMCVCIGLNWSMSWQAFKHLGCASWSIWMLSGSWQTRSFHILFADILIINGLYLRQPRVANIDHFNYHILLHGIQNHWLLIKLFEGSQFETLVLISWGKKWTIQLWLKCIVWTAKLKTVSFSNLKCNFENYIFMDEFQSEILRHISLMVHLCQLWKTHPGNQTFVYIE